MSELHTPGPWFATISEVEANRSTIMGKHGWIAAIQHNGEGIMARQEADAHLMAAAPDLLKACRKSAELILAMESGRACTMSITALALHDMLVEAISKAEGKP